MIQLALGEGVGRATAERIHQFVFDEALFDMKAFAPIPHRLAKGAAEKPVQERYARRLHDIEVAADDCREIRVALRHRLFKFADSPGRSSEREVKVEQAYGAARCCDVHTEPVSILKS